MKPVNYLIFIVLWMFCLTSAHADTDYKQAESALLQDEIMAIAYSGFREGQHPDRGNGGVYPSEAEILEDLQILSDKGFRLIRLYDSKDMTKLTLELIRKHQLPLKVMLGMWIDAELSNHEGCAWLDKPIPDETLSLNKIANRNEVKQGIELANTFQDIVVAVNVGNEALINWTDHLVSVESMITYVREVKKAIKQPVTVAENYVWWIQEGEILAKELDFIGVHTYPVWEDRDIDEGLSYTAKTIEDVHAALPDHKIAILEAGWATTANEFGERASEEKQKRYFKELKNWAKESNTTVFFFEAFDEPWKGDPNNSQGAEKHWGLFFVDRTPKLVMQE